MHFVVSMFKSLHVYHITIIHNLEQTVVCMFKCRTCVDYGNVVFSGCLGCKTIAHFMRLAPKHA